MLELLMNKQRQQIYTKEIITPIGQMLAAATEGGLILLGFAENPALGFELKKTVDSLGGTFANSGSTLKNRHLEKLGNEIKEYFTGKRKVFDIPVIFTGTDFQKKPGKHSLLSPTVKSGVTAVRQNILICRKQYGQSEAQMVPIKSPL